MKSIDNNTVSINNVNTTGDTNSGINVGGNLNVLISNNVKTTGSASNAFRITGSNNNLTTNVGLTTGTGSNGLSLSNGDSNYAYRNNFTAIAANAASRAIFFDESNNSRIIEGILSTSSSANDVEVDIGLNNTLVGSKSMKMAS